MRPLEKVKAHIATTEHLFREFIREDKPHAPRAYLTSLRIARVSHTDEAFLFFDQERSDIELPVMTNIRNDYCFVEREIIALHKTLLFFPAHTYHLVYPLRPPSYVLARFSAVYKAIDRAHRDVQKTITDEVHELVITVAALAFSFFVLFIIVAYRVFRFEGKHDLFFQIARRVNGELQGEIRERKRIEQALRESEEQHRTLIESAHDTILIVHAGRICYANTSAKTLFACDTSELREVEFTDLVHESNRAYLAQEMHSVELLKKGTRIDEARIVRNDATLLYVEMSIGLTIFKGEEAFLVFIRDKSEQKATEERLWQEERLIKAILENSSDGIIVFSDDAHVTLCNPVVYDIFGYHCEERMTLASVIERIGVDRKQKDVMLRVWDRERVRASGRSYVFSFNHHDGTRKWCRATIARMREDAILVNVSEITALVQSQEAMRESRAWYKAVIDSFDGYISVCSSDATIEYLNPQLAEKLEGTQVGDACVRYMHWFPELCRECRAGTRSSILHKRREMQSAEDGRWYDVVVTPIQHGTDTYSTLTMAQDITERVLAQREAAAKTEELRVSNDDLRQFAYAASHDLKEPLRMITSYLQLITRRYGKIIPKEGHEFISFAVDGAERMHVLIQGLLSYSRAGTTEIEKTDVDLSLVLAETLMNLSVSIREADATVTYDEGLPKVRGNKMLLLLLFQNLISNALKFHEKGTKPKVHVGMRTDDTERTFFVKDNGIGIPKAELENVFVVFNRLHGQSAYAGTGLGLAICKRVVIRHGGRIWVTSEEGVGSTFYFTLPRRS